MLASKIKSLSDLYGNTKKKTTIGDGVHSRTPRNKHSTKKKYRGQGK